MFQLGIDVSKKTLDLCLLREGAKGNVKTRKLQNDINAVDAVIAWLSKQYCKPEDVHITTEAIGAYHESLVYGLHKAGGRTSLANPYRARESVWGMGMLTKNGRIDVYMLVCYGALKAPEPWFPPLEEVRYLSAPLHRRDALVADSTREKNRLEKYPAADTPSVTVESVETMIGQLNTEIKRLDRPIRSRLNQYPELKKDFDLLTSMKPVGYQLGLNIFAILRNHNFATAEQVAASLGVVPAEKYPGILVRGRLKLLKIGPPEIRVKLYLVSLCGLRFNLLMKAIYERLCLRGKGKVCVTGALTRKLVHWCYGVLKTQRPFDMGYSSSYARSACKAA